MRKNETKTRKRRSQQEELDELRQDFRRFKMIVVIWVIFVAIITVIISLEFSNIWRAVDDIISKHNLLVDTIIQGTKGARGVIQV
jgi:hypothetical protein